MTLTFSKYFEQYTNYHSFTDLLNFCKEVADYVYNHDVIRSDYFDAFVETKDGYDILFNRSGQKNYFINANKKTVKDEKGDDQLIDSVYEDIENLYNIIKNYEIQINIKQMDEVKSFNQMFVEPVNEGFSEELEGKLSDKYLSLKRGILDLLDKTLNSDTTKLQNYIDTYIDPNTDEVLDGFVEDADIFDFYLKYQADVDQILDDNNYYSDSPDVTSLYDYVIDGTFDAVIYCMEDMKKELYEE